jgi:uncharacterized membrane protein
MFKIFKTFPIWFRVIWVIALATILLSIFYLDNFKTALFALFILSICNGIRAWRIDKRLSITSFILSIAFLYIFSVFSF